MLKRLGAWIIRKLACVDYDPEQFMESRGSEYFGTYFIDYAVFDNRVTFKAVVVSTGQPFINGTLFFAKEYYFGEPLTDTTKVANRFNELFNQLKAERK